MKYYLVIDLKTFYASVECALINLDPFKTNLVVADESRGSGTVCLAITPKLKKMGIKNRCRLYEIPSNIKIIIAKPRMKKYIEYSALIYKVYLKYVSPNDIHVYSIDEVFIDATSYLKLYKKNIIDFAKLILDDIYKSTKITATCGIGTNMYLAKIALDIISKHVKSNIGFLNEDLFKKYLWKHEPLSDFWQIGDKIEARLHKLHINNMHDITLTNEKLLYKEFGINAKLLIDHAYGIETCTISDVKNYKHKSNSISSSQVLLEDINYEKARVILTEMIDNLVQKLVLKNKYTDLVGFVIGYSKYVIPSIHISKKLENQTNNFSLIKSIIISEYDFQINKHHFIRKIGVFFDNLKDKKYEQLDLFNNLDNKKESYLEKIINDIKSKYGSNAILRSISYSEYGNQLERNKLIGGHNAE